MGQCFSSGASRAQGSEPSTPALAQGVADLHLYPVVQASMGGLAIAVSSGRCGATGGGGSDAVLVKTTAQLVFVALFEGLGDQGRAVASFCRSAAWEAFQECSVRHPGAPLDALRASLERLDAAIFATDRLQHAAKTGSGASAVLLLLDLGSQRCYCANVGAAACLLSRISGSFNAKFPEGFFLSAEHTTSNREEKVRQQKRAPGEATPPRSATVSGGGEAGGAAEATRALGFMEVKSQAGGSGALVCDAYVTDHSLTMVDQHLILGTAGFWRLVGPADCALRAHFHEKFAQRELDRVAAVAAAAGDAAEAPSPSLLRAANTAEHLVYWALEKATRQLARLQQQRAGGGGSKASGGGASGNGKLSPSVADLLVLPLVRPPAALVAAASGGEESGAQQQQEEEEQPPALIRSDVFRDLGVVVVTLRRNQGQSMDGGMREILMAARARADAQQAQQGGAAGGGYVERLGRRRWDQIRMLVDFHKANRRVVLRRWWEAQDALFRRGRTTGAGAGRIQLFASTSPSPNSPSKLPALAAAAAARRTKVAAGGEDQGRAANKAAAGAVAAKGSPARGVAAGAKASPARGVAAGAKASPARSAGKQAGVPSCSTVGKTAAAIRPSSRIGSGIKAARPGSASS